MIERKKRTSKSMKDSLLQLDSQSSQYQFLFNMTCRSRCVEEGYHNMLHGSTWNIHSEYFLRNVLETLSMSPPHYHHDILLLITFSPTLVTAMIIKMWRIMGISAVLYYNNSFCVFGFGLWYEVVGWCCELCDVMWMEDMGRFFYLIIWLVG